MSLTPKNRHRFWPVWTNSNERDVANFHRDMNNFMEQFFGRAPMTTTEGFEIAYPVVDLQEREDHYQIEAELPGMTQDDIHLEMHNNTLTIRGEKKSECEDKKGDSVRTERFFGSFRRDIPFEMEVDPELTKAELRKGVLHIEVGKKERSRESKKRIEIK